MTSTADTAHASLAALLAEHSRPKRMRLFREAWETARGPGTGAFMTGVELLALTGNQEQRSRIVEACTDFYDRLPAPTQRPDPKLDLSEEGIGRLIEKERRTNKDPTYGGFLLPLLGLYASFDEETERSAFRRSLLMLLNDPEPGPRGVRRRNEFAAQLCSSFLLFERDLALAQTSYVV